MGGEGAVNAKGRVVPLRVSSCFLISFNGPAGAQTNYYVWIRGYTAYAHM